MPVSRITRLQDLIDLLTEADTAHQVNHTDLTVQIPTNSGALIGELFVRFERTLPYAQVVHPMVMNVPADRLADVEHAICLANNTIPLPGFGYNYQSNFIYFRLCVPLYEGGMATADFQRQMLGVINNARDFLIAFRHVIAGRPGDDIMSLAVAATVSAAPPARA